MDKTSDIQHIFKTELLVEDARVRFYACCEFDTQHETCLPKSDQPLCIW